jgi:hypothetical protein
MSDTAAFVLFICALPVLVIIAVIAYVYLYIWLLIIFDVLGRPIGALVRWWGR